MFMNLTDKLRRPEYTGENRCLPCTVINLAIAVAAAVLTGVLFAGLGVSTAGRVVAGGLVLIGSVAAVYLRGYLVPGTPTLTKRYLPRPVLRLFGKAPEPDRTDAGDGLVYTIDVPDLANNNPSYVWVRPATCPEPIDTAADVDVELRVECDDSNDSALITEGTLRSVINELREDNGKPLRCRANEDTRCFQPGESVDLVLEVTESTIDEQFTFEFEFYAVQCRYNTGTSTPFNSLNPCGKAISFIAFCSESGDPDPTITSINNTDDDGPTSVDWRTESDVDYVVAKSGQNFTIYDLRDNATTSGTVTTGNDENADFYGEVSGTVEDGFEPAEGSTSTDTNNSNSASSNPCELAADRVGSGDFPDDGTCVKLEESNGEFNEEQ